MASDDDRASDDEPLSCKLAKKKASTDSDPKNWPDSGEDSGTDQSDEDDEEHEEDCGRLCDHCALHGLLQVLEWVSGLDMQSDQEWGQYLHRNKIAGNQPTRTLRKLTELHEDLVNGMTDDRLASIARILPFDWPSLEPAAQKNFVKRLPNLTQGWVPSVLVTFADNQEFIARLKKLERWKFLSQEMFERWASDKTSLAELCRARIADLERRIEDVKRGIQSNEDKATQARHTEEASTKSAVVLQRWVRWQILAKRKQFYAQRARQIRTLRIQSNARHTAILNTKIQGFQAVNHNLREQHQSEVSMMQGLNDQSQKHSQKLKTEVSRLEHSDQELARVRQELVTAQQQRAVFQTNNQSFAKRNQKLSDRVSELESSELHARQDANKREKSLAKVKQACAHLASENHALQAKLQQTGIDSVFEMQKEFDQDRTQLIDEINSLKIKLDTNTAELTAARTLHNRAKKEDRAWAKELKSQLEAKTAELAQLAEVQARQQEEHDKNRDHTHAQLLGHIEVLNAKLAEKSSDLSQSEARVEQLRTDLNQGLLVQFKEKLTVAPPAPTMVNLPVDSGFEFDHLLDVNNLVSLDDGDLASMKRMAEGVLAALDLHEESLQFQCPISNDVIKEPTVAPDGHTYDLASIEGHLAMRDAKNLSATSPITNEPFAHRLLVPNFEMKQRLDTFNKKKLAHQQEFAQHTGASNETSPIQISPSPAKSSPQPTQSPPSPQSQIIPPPPPGAPPQSSIQPPNPVGIGAPPPIRQSHTGPRALKWIVKLRGLPFSATKVDLGLFFDGLRIADGGIVFVKDHLGRASGKAFVGFATLAQAKTAVGPGFHKKNLGHRFVECFRSSPQELQKVIAEFANNPESTPHRTVQKLLVGVDVAALTRDVRLCLLSCPNHEVRGAFFKRTFQQATGRDFPDHAPAKLKDVLQSLDGRIEVVGAKALAKFRLVLDPSQSSANQSSPPAAPESQDALSGTRLWVGNLPLHWKVAQIRDVFGEFGQVKAKLFTHISTGDSKGAGFVDYERASAAQEASHELDGYTPPDGDLPLVVHFAKKKVNAPTTTTITITTAINNKEQLGPRRVPQVHSHTDLSALANDVEMTLLSCSNHEVFASQFKKKFRATTGRDFPESCSAQWNPNGAPVTRLKDILHTLDCGVQIVRPPAEHRDHGSVKFRLVRR